MNVKPGDLAIQIKSVAGNEGAICEIIGPMGITPIFNGSIWNKDSGFYWFVKWIRPQKTNLGSIYSSGPCPDAWLRPVSGLPDTEHTDEREPIKELA